MRLWGGRFERGERRARRRFHALDRDRPRARRSTTSRGSIAHVRGLGRAGLLTDDEVATLVERARGPGRDVEAGALEWDPALEDVHLNLEAALAERIGPVAGKLHTGRSRNDQVATDLRLWLAPGDRPAGRARCSTSSARSSTWPSGTATAVLPGHDPHPAGPAGAASPTTCSPTSRCSSATAAGSPTRAARLNV